MDLKETGCFVPDFAILSNKSTDVTNNNICYQKISTHYGMNTTVGYAHPVSGTLIPTGTSA